MRGPICTPHVVLRPSRALLGIAIGAVLALGSSSCSIVSGEHQADTKFLVKPSSQASFSGWSEITISEDPNSVDGATLRFIRLEAKDTSIADLTFIKEITAEATVDNVSTLVAKKGPMPAGERIVPLDRVYTGDIRKFFYKADDGDGYTVHIDWQGAVDPAKPIPPDGAWILVTVAISVD